MASVLVEFRHDRVELSEDETFDDLLVEYADSYADRTWTDHAQLESAIHDGEIEVIKDL